MKPPNAPDPAGQTGGRRNRPAGPPVDEVDRDSDDSFPASDPPAWIPVCRVGEPQHQTPSRRPSVRH